MWHNFVQSTDDPLSMLAAGAVEQQRPHPDAARHLHVAERLVAHAEDLIRR
jgi:hypothetical protein